MVYSHVGAVFGNYPVLANTEKLYSSSTVLAQHHIILLMHIIDELAMPRLYPFSLYLRLDACINRNRKPREP